MPTITLSSDPHGSVSAHLNPSYDDPPCDTLAPGAFRGCAWGDDPDFPECVPEIRWQPPRYPDADYASSAELAEGSEEARQRQRQQMGEYGLPFAVRTKKGGMLFRLMPSGSFVVAEEAAQDPEGQDNENVTLERVIIAAPLYVGVSEVTLGQWRQVMEDVQPDNKAPEDDFPVVDVSWEECREFCRRLCVLEEVPEGIYRLLAEDEWEYACRAGTAGTFYTGDDVASLGKAGWYRANSGGQPHAVAQKQPNAWGLHDFHGNVWEWCESLPGAGGGNERPGSRPPAVLRGGGWDAQPEACSSASRLVQPAEFKDSRAGFRVARTIGVTFFNR